MQVSLHDISVDNHCVDVRAEGLRKLEAMQVLHFVG